MKGSFRFILGFFMVLVSFSMIESMIPLMFMGGFTTLLIGLGLMLIGTKDLEDA